MGKSKDKVVAIVRAMAQELIDKADELIVSNDAATDLDIWFRIRPGESPEIEIQRTLISTRGFSVDLGIPIMDTDPFGEE